MKSEAVVDLFQYIKAIRIQRADMVSNKVCNSCENIRWCIAIIELE